MQGITPWLWFDGQAEEAALFYVSIFDDAKLLEVTRYPEGTPMPAGGVMTASFQLQGQTFVALNGGPDFRFTEATSFQVECDDQEEIDRLWSALCEDGGEESQCGWLKDKYGLSWQIVPAAMNELLSDEDPAAAQRAMKAMLGMRKLDIQALLDAKAAV
jgi:predicted 3-demethylubiquinone-9 3-methyltransferase (glyoxalase superfamily)